MRKLLNKLGLSLLIILLVFSSIYVYFYTPRTGSKDELSQIKITNNVGPIINIVSGSIYNGTNKTITELNLMVGTQPINSENIFEIFDDANQKEYKLLIRINPKSTQTYNLEILNENRSSHVFVSIKSVNLKLL
jgi:hypothetical protein